MEFTFFMSVFHIFLSAVKVTEHIHGQDRWFPWILQGMAGVHAWSGSTAPLGKIQILKPKHGARGSHEIKFLNKSNFKVLGCTSKLVFQSVNIDLKLAL